MMTLVKEKSRKFFQNLALVFFSLLFALIVGEILVRIFVYVPTIPSKPMPKILAHQATENLDLLYKPVPNASAEVYGAQVHYNSLGFRDKEYPLEAAPGTKRVVFLGDSVVFGLGVPAEETIPKHLERLVQQETPKTEVLNLGVAGYDSIQEVEFFKDLGVRLKPDLVIVGYTLNDAIFGSAEMGMMHDESNHQIRMTRKEWRKQFLAFLWTKSHLFAFLDFKFRLQEKCKSLRSYKDQNVWFWIQDRNKEFQDPANSPYQQLKQKVLEDGKKKGTNPENLKKMLGILGIDNDPFYSSHWNLSKKSFLELKALSKKYNFKVAVVIFPYLIDLEHYALGSAHQFLRSEFESMGFDVTDTQDLLIEARAKHGKAIELDPIHFSGLGSEIVAKYLHDNLKERKLL